MAARNEWKTEGFPLYYPGSNQFLANSEPSGIAGAQAKVDIILNNYPHVLYGVRITNTYPTVVDDTTFDVPAGYNIRDRDSLLIYDEEQKITVEFAQQNITAKPIMQSTMTGRKNGVLWHMFPTPYLLRGANQVTVQGTRTQSYPNIGDTQNPFLITPTLEVTLLTTVLISDLMPGAAPGSTAHPDMYRG